MKNGKMLRKQLEKTRKIIRKHFFTTGDFVGHDSYLERCKICGEQAWLPEYIKHKKKCELYGIQLKESEAQSDSN